MGVFRFLNYVLFALIAVTLISIIPAGIYSKPLFSNIPGSNEPNSNNPNSAGSNDPLSNDPAGDLKKNAPRENNFIINTELAEEVFLNLSYERLLAYPLSAVLYEDKLYLPAEEFLNGLKINHEVRNSKYLIEGLFITNNQSYSIDFRNFIAKIGEKYIELNEKDFIAMNDNYYVMPGIFENMFNIKIDVNFNNLVVDIKSRDKLPPKIFHERDIKRGELLNETDEQVKVPLVYKKERNYLNAGFLDYSVSGNFMNKTDPNYNYNFDLGTEILGGDLKTTLNGGIEKGRFNQSNLNFLWKYALNTNPYLNQIYVGELNYTGQYNGIVNGIQITNTPVEPRVSFDKYTITERTIPNSDVELYINNQLYDFKKADALGNVYFEVPLNFGSNFIYMKIFSPTGEVIDNQKKIQVPSGFLPQASVDYNMSFGELKDSKDKLISGSVSGGLTNWLTSSVGIEKIAGPGSQEPTFYNTTLARIFSQYILNVIVSPQVYNRAILSASFVSNMYFEAGHTQFKDNKFYNRAGIFTDSYLKGILPFELGGEFFVTQFQVKRTEFINNEEVFKADIEQTLNFNDFNMSLRFNHIRNNLTITPDVFEDGSLSSSTNKIFLGTNYMVPDFEFFKRNLLNTNVNYNITDKRFESFQTVFSTNITESIRMQLKYQTSFTKGSNDISAQFVFELPFVKNFVTVGQNSFSNSIQGSVGMDLNYKKVLLYNRNQVGLSAVSFRMFYDENNSGKYENGEEILKHGKLNFKQSAALDNSDEDVLRVTELVPNQECIVEVNESFLDNPLLIPKYKRFSFIPSANIYRPIDIPFNMSQEVYGSITVKKGDQELRFGGVEVIVKNLETNEQTVLSSYFDGGIYALQFMPGDYVAYVKPSLVKNLNAVSYPEKINFTISGKKEDNQTNELNFLLELPDK